MTKRRNAHQTKAIFLAGVLMACSAGQAQQAPSQSVGLTTGVKYHDNLGLDGTSLGSTTEVFTTLDFALAFSTPLQELRLTGAATLRGLDGAEAGSIADGFTDPNLRLKYDRQVRDARLSFSAFALQSETSTQVAEFNGIDVSLVNEDATRLSFGYDAELEMRRENPFGITLLASHRGLRYSDTSSATLRDQDRVTLGARFRFDINPVLKATLTARHATFELEGAATTRETTSLDGSLLHSLKAGSLGLTANITHVEEGTRYSLSVARDIESPDWKASGTFGLTESIGSGLFPTGTLDLARQFDSGSLSVSLSHDIRSGLQDSEQEFSSLQVGYAHVFDAKNSVRVAAQYSESNPTGVGVTTSFGTVGLGYQRNLAPGWQMDVGLNRRVSTNTAGVTARDNNLSFTVRRELFAKR